jgi:hypothetical protein
MTTITEEVCKNVEVVLLKYDFVDVSKDDPLNTFHMERSVGEFGTLSVWGRGSYDPSVCTNLRFQWDDGSSEGMIQLIQTNDAALLETVVQHTLTFMRSHDAPFNNRQIASHKNIAAKILH